MVLPGRSLLLGAGTHRNAAPAAVVTYAAIVVAVVDSGVIDIVKTTAIQIVVRAVIEKVPVIPTAAVVSIAEVTEAIVDATIEANGSSPVTFIVEIAAVIPSPIAGGPEVTFFRRKLPRAGNLIVIGDAVVIGPVAGGPHISIAGARGLVVHGQCGRADGNPDANLSEHGGRNGQYKKRQQKADGTHVNLLARSSFDCPP